MAGAVDDSTINTLHLRYNVRRYSALSFITLIGRWMMIAL